MKDDAFFPSREDLERAIALQCGDRPGRDADELPRSLPDQGVGAHEALRQLAPIILGRARRLGAPLSFAHMDPPTPWISWVVSQWTASVNQNLLHPDTSPSARALERQLIAWLGPVFGMDGGHMTAGSTLANITAIWAARECRHIRRVVTSDAAHLSIKKAAHLLGLGFESIATDTADRLPMERLPDDLSDACLVLSAGTTGCGAIDPLAHNYQAGWLHVDAAWAGPLALCDEYRGRLDGIERADSIAVSAHKWFFQPKESAMILFRDEQLANEAISFGGAYLAAPNVGILGSHGANAAPLIGTLLAWGRAGMQQRIARCIRNADRLAAFIESRADLMLFTQPQSAVVVWRPRGSEKLDHIGNNLPLGSTSRTTLDDKLWFRNVAANPNADVEQLIESLTSLLR